MKTIQIPLTNIERSAMQKFIGSDFAKFKTFTSEAAIVNFILAKFAAGNIDEIKPGLAFPASHLKVKGKAIPQPLSVEIGESLFTAILEIAKENDRPFARQVRRIIRLALQGKERELLIEWGKNENKKD